MMDEKINHDEKIKQIIEKYKCKLDPSDDNLEDIKKQVDMFLSFLDTKRYNIVTLSKSLYNLRSQAERICRYKEYGNYEHLSDIDCDDLLDYVNNEIIKFLSKPVEGSNIYLYVTATNSWIIVSPAGYLWLITGDTLKQIHLLGKYLLSIVNENPSLLEFKQAKEFADKFLAMMFFIENKPLFSILLEDDGFMEGYKYICNAISEKSSRNKVL